MARFGWSIEQFSRSKFIGPFFYFDFSKMNFRCSKGIKTNDEEKIFFA